MGKVKAFVTLNVNKCLCVNAEKMRITTIGTERQQINQTSDLAKERVELIIIQAEWKKMKTKQ